MKHQNLKAPKNQSLDRLLSWYENSKRIDEIEIKREKEEFIKQIKKFKKQDIKNSTEELPQSLTIWMRIKKALGIG